MRKSSLAAGLEAAAGRTPPASETAARQPVPSKAVAQQPATVMIGAHYPKDVRKALKLVEAETGRGLKPLLGEAINDLCAKYGKPQPYTPED